MDGTQASISSQKLYARLGLAAAPIVVDDRAPPAFAAAQAPIAHESGARAP